MTNRKLDRVLGYALYIILTVMAVGSVPFILMAS